MEGERERVRVDVRKHGRWGTKFYVVDITIQRKATCRVTEADVQEMEPILVPDHG